jgi:hypothetical protein
MTALTAPTPDTPEVEEDEVQIDDVAEILAEPHTITVVGVECELRRLRTREFLALTRVITGGLGARLGLLMESFDSEADPAEQAGQMAAILVNAIPEAPDQMIDFMRLMVTPKEGDPAAYRTVNEAMQNPDLDLMVEVITGIVDAEADNLVGLGKAFGHWWKTAGVATRLRTPASSQSGT